MRWIRLLLQIAVGTGGASCAHDSASRLTTPEPRECAVVSQLLHAEVLKLAGSDEVLERASAAPIASWTDYASTVADAKTKRTAASWRRCPALAERIDPIGGTDFSRVAFSPDSTRAVVSVQCGAWLLRRGDPTQPWEVEGMYVASEGCAS